MSEAWRVKRERLIREAEARQDAAAQERRDRQIVAQAPWHLAHKLRGKTALVDCYVVAWRGRVAIFATPRGAVELALALSRLQLD